jgi:hypothetical protein
VKDELINIVVVPLEMIHFRTGFFWNIGNCDSIRVAWFWKKTTKIINPYFSGEFKFVNSLLLQSGDIFKEMIFAVSSLRGSLVNVTEKISFSHLPILTSICFSNINSFQIDSETFTSPK